jgi:hypothetical protein
MMDESTVNEEAFDEARQQMVESQIAARGVRDARVLDAMREVPRHLFVPPELAEFAYSDTPLPLDDGQTISQPVIVARMLEAAQLTSAPVRVMRRPSRRGLWPTWTASNGMRRSPTARGKRCTSTLSTMSPCITRTARAAGPPRRRSMRSSRRPAARMYRGRGASNWRSAAGS